MIIAIITNDQGQAQMSWEPHDPVMARQVLSGMIDLVDKQFPDAAPPGTPKRSGLIIPATVIPPNMTGNNGTPL